MDHLKQRLQPVALESHTTPTRSDMALSTSYCPRSLMSAERRLSASGRSSWAEASGCFACSSTAPFKGKFASLRWFSS